MQAPVALEDESTVSSIVLKWGIVQPGPSDAPVTHYEVRPSYGPTFP